MVIPSVQPVIFSAVALLPPFQHWLCSLYATHHDDQSWLSFFSWHLSNIQQNSSETRDLPPLQPICPSPVPSSVSPALRLLLSARRTPTNLLLLLCSQTGDHNSPMCLTFHTLTYHCWCRELTVSLNKESKVHSQSHEMKWLTPENSSDFLSSRI